MTMISGMNGLLHGYPHLCTGASRLERGLRVFKARILRERQREEGKKHS